MQKVKVADLVLDYGLYPRGSVNSKNVSEIATARMEGVDVPPVLACQKTKRVVDGFHRYKAEILAFGDDAEIDVLFKRYKNDQALFLDSVRYNASHGYKLQSFDRTRCTLIAERLQIDLTELSKAINIPAEKLEKLRMDRVAKNQNLSQPIKTTIRHMTGRRMNRRQWEANEKLSGMQQVFYANQLIELIESKLLDASDKKLMKRLAHLSELLSDL